MRRYGGNISCNSPACHSCSGSARVAVARLSPVQALIGSFLWLTLGFPKEISSGRSQEQLTLFLCQCYTSPSSSLVQDDNISTCTYVFSSLVRESLDILLKFLRSLHFARLEDLLESTMAHFPGFLCLEIRLGRGHVSPLLVSVLDTLSDHRSIKCLASRVGNIISFFLIKTQPK